MKLNHWQQHEPILLAFEKAWADQPTPDLDAFLPPTDQNGYLDLLAELVLIDFERRCEQSSTGNLDGYLSRYPELTADETIRDELLQQEFRLRQKFGMAPTPAEIETRFGTEATAVRILEEVYAADVLPSRSATVIQPGMRIAGYIIGEVIGSGTFSTVYSATDTSLNRRVALKFLTHSSDVRPESGIRLQREAQAIASLRHPNIVPVFGAGRHLSHDYIVTQLVEGVSLSEHLRNHKLSVRCAVDLVRQLASALEQVHTLGIVHRDIKPANIMLENGIPLLVDFGLATLADSSLQLTQEGDMVGTPAYMSPEQADGRAWQADPRSDIYSLGAVLYRLVCGTLPFEGTTSEVISKVLNQEPSVPSKVASRIGKDLHTIILKCLQKEPLHRFQSAGELESDLQCFLAGTPINAKPIGFISRFVSLARRYPLLATAILAMLILTGFLFGVATQLGHVSLQRDDAQMAERETQSLLAESAANAGQLAMQRGQITVALKNFQVSLERGHPNRCEILLKLVEAHLIQGQVGAAYSRWSQARSAADSNSNKVMLRLWEAELALEGRHDLGDGVQMMRQVRQRGLPQAEGFYVDGILANTSPEAVSLFSKCTLADPFHHRARRMLITTQLALAQLDDAADEIRIARQLFPEDVDFMLMDCLCRAAANRLEEAMGILAGSGLNEEAADEWNQLCRKLNSLTSDRAIDSGMGELDVDKLADILDIVSSSFIPMFAQRRWRLPPLIELQLSEFMRDFTAVPMKGDEKPIETVARVSKIHPEASLLTILGGLRLLQCDADPTRREFEIPILEQARTAYREVLTRPGFLKRDDQMAWKAIFTISTILAHTMNHEAESNFLQVLESAAVVKTDSIKSPSRARTFVILTMEQGHLDEASRWIDRWITLAQHGDSSWQHAIWHKAVLCKHREQWIEVWNCCDQLRDVNPDYPAVVPLRDFAITQLRTLLDERSTDSQQ